MNVSLQELYDQHRFNDALKIPSVKKLKSGGNPHRVEMKAAKMRLHSQLPETDLWTYEGTFPGPTFEVESGD